MSTVALNTNYTLFFNRMGSHTIGSMIVDQIEKAGFDTKDLKITGCPLRWVE